MLVLMLVADLSPSPSSRTRLHTSSTCLFQIICGQNCTFVVEPSGTVSACGEGSYGRLGQGNSDDLHTLVVISTLQGEAFDSTQRCHMSLEKYNKLQDWVLALVFTRKEMVRFLCLLTKSLYGQTNGMQKTEK